jgi:hypothetical protein
MMSSTAWAHHVLSSVTLHSIIGTMLCRCVTRPIAVADRWPTRAGVRLQSHYSPELLNHSAL